MRSSELSSLVLLASALSGSLALSLQPLHPHHHHRPTIHRRRALSPLLADDADTSAEEIAALEERLKQLKIAEAEKEAMQARAAAAYEADNALSEDEVSQFDPTTLSFRKKVANTRVAPPSELLSESWKSEEEEEEGAGGGGGGGLASVVGPVVGLLALVAFSQIPIGDVSIEVGEQNVGVESTAALRERYSKIGVEDE